MYAVHSNTPRMSSAILQGQIREACKGVTINREISSH